MRVSEKPISLQPTISTNLQGKIDVKGLAVQLAPLTRMLRDGLIDAIDDANSPLARFAKERRQPLSSDSLAQTVVFALLMGRGDGADPLTLASARASISAGSHLLSRVLEALENPETRAAISTPLDLLLRVIAAIPPFGFPTSGAPWLRFCEEYLAACDPDLRKNAGAYYTPVEVVRCQVRLIDDLLANRLDRPLGFTDPDIITVDPAAGTGAYLLGIIEHALGRIESEQGMNAVPARAMDLSRNLTGFELMVGPCAVAELCVEGALRDRGAEIPEGSVQIQPGDTLEDPKLAHSARAFEGGGKAPVIVCLGNPPYGRHKAATFGNKAHSGGWVRWGDTKEGTDAIFRHFLDPAIAAGHGVHLKNLYNLYVYFWRWALWRVYEHPSVRGPGIVCFVSASSYLDGKAFCGMREHLRRQCDEVWILDLGGEGRGTRKTDNVFAIQTPIAIALAVRYSGASNQNQPARVSYACIEGERSDKLAALDAIGLLADVAWQDCPDNWQAPFRPAGRGEYFTWPLLTDLMPWQHSGAQFKRTWPICHDGETLRQRWRTLLSSSDKARMFRETRDRTITSSCPQSPPYGNDRRPLAVLGKDAQEPPIARYAYRSFDRQWCFADNRLGDFLRPPLWRANGNQQVFLTTLTAHPLGSGPALTACSHVPDLCHFRGSFGAKDTIPLYRSADASEANIQPNLLALLAATHGRGKQARPADFLAYVYGVLAHPAFTDRFREELGRCELRVPITKDAALFEKMRAIGARLLWLHTYGERFVPEGKMPGQTPRGMARCTKDVPGEPDCYPEGFDYKHSSLTLRVGLGDFAPVSREVFEFEVSGLRVAQSWLKYRMKKGAGRKSSPLDEVRPERWTSQFTADLLELLWVLEATVEDYPEQADTLDAIIRSECFQVDELPPVLEEMRRPPRA